MPLYWGGLAELASLLDVVLLEFLWCHLASNDLDLLVPNVLSMNCISTSTLRTTHGYPFN